MHRIWHASVLLVPMWMAPSVPATSTAAPALDHMYAVRPGAEEVLRGSHHLVFAGEAEVSGYNNHAYLAFHRGKFWAIWSCGFRDGGHAGQQVRYATSVDGLQWSPWAAVTPSPKDGYYIARGLWIRDGELLALAARMLNSRKVVALEVSRWAGNRWVPAGMVGEEIMNNYAPLPLPTGEWMVPYRFREQNRVDGVLVGGVKALDDWRRIPFPGNEHEHVTEANAVIRGDGSIAIHFRDNRRGGTLYRSVSTDGGRSFTALAKTDFPDCTSKHFCLKLSTGRYVLINNPRHRGVLQMAGSADGVVFTETAKLRYEPVALRMPGGDKGAPYSYPHAIEHEGHLYVIYAVHRDDIWLTRIALAEIDRALGGAPPRPASAAHKR
jgi:hypothetical protein